jgi:hypothetical protein
MSEGVQRLTADNEFEILERRGKPSPRMPLTLSSIVTLDSVTMPAFSVERKVGENKSLC